MGAANCCSKPDEKEFEIISDIKKNKNTKDNNISNYCNSRPETEINSNRKNSFKINNNRKQDLLPFETPKQMIISYYDFKNIMNKKNLKIEFKKNEIISKTEKNSSKKEKLCIKNNDTKINHKNTSNNNNNNNYNLKKKKHQ